jgi:ribosomal protein L34E
VPAKAAAAPRRRRPRPPGSFHRADADTVQAALDRLLTIGVGRYPSQAAFLRAFRPALRAEDPRARIAGPRLRSLLVQTPGVRLVVRYSERARGARPHVCPVCGGPLADIQNRTLSGGTVAIGQKCARCGYWMHRLRRVPVRYQVQRTARPSVAPEPTRPSA